MSRINPPTETQYRGYAISFTPVEGQLRRYVATARGHYWTWNSRMYNDWVKAEAAAKREIDLRIQQMERRYSHQDGE